MQIHKGSNTQIIPFFKEREFFSTSPNAPDPHYLDDVLIRAMGIIRDHFQTPVIITSTFRTISHNNSIAGSRNSQHLQGKAIDGKFTDPDTLERYYQDITGKGSLYWKLREAGIKGFGLYDNFFHIDTREEPGEQTDKMGTLTIWDNSQKKNSYLGSLVRSFRNTEDGFTDWIRTIRTAFLLLFLIFTGIVIYNTRKKWQ